MHDRLSIVLMLVTTGLLIAIARGGPPEDKRTADEIEAAAKQAGENGVEFAKAVRAGDEAAARSMIGADINIGGERTQRSKEQWTIKSPWGITIVATKINGEADPNVELENNICSAWGKLKRIDMKTKTITLENTELIYVEKLNLPK